MGGGRPEFRSVRSKSLTNLIEKGERRFREMEIGLEVQNEIDLCILNANSIGGISGSCVLSALETEPEESKITEYF